MQNIHQDAGLVEWFFQLTPAQRLAELESRIAFLMAGGSELDPKDFQEFEGMPLPRR